jgi:L-serine dehydratase
MNIFDILGPIMVGPSSSHTAGAARIGQMARALLGAQPVKARIHLHGSFAETGAGHGTDRALVGGLLGMKPDDLRIPFAFDEAEKEGLDYTIDAVELRDAHPNTAVLEVQGESGAYLKMQASSTGGGRIRVDKINGVDVGFTGAFNTLVIYSTDISGKLAEVTQLLSRGRVNIANMNLCRSRRGGSVLMVIETDETVPPVVRQHIGELPGVEGVTYYDKEAE